MYSHSAIHLEDQQFPVRRLAAIDADIFQVQPFGDRPERRAMAAAEILVKTREEAGFLLAFGRVFRHPGGHVVDYPMVGYGHVAGVGPAVDEDDTIFTEKAVPAPVIEVGRSIEMGLRPGLQVFEGRLRIV